MGSILALFICLHSWCTREGCRTILTVDTYKLAVCGGLGYIHLFTTVWVIIHGLLRDLVYIRTVPNHFRLLLCMHRHPVIAAIDPKQPRGDALKNEPLDSFGARTASFLQMCRFQVPQDVTGFKV